MSLHCEWCLAQALERRRAREAKERAQTPEDRRWEAMARAIASDDRLGREDAAKLLQKARDLPSATPARLQGLNLAFDRRFDHPAPGASWGTYANKSLPGEEGEQAWERGHEP